MNRINQIKRWMNENKNYSVIKMVRESDDDGLSETGRCVKYAYELLAALDTPNAPGELPGANNK